MFPTFPPSDWEQHLIGILEMFGAETVSQDDLDHLTDRILCLVEHFVKNGPTPSPYDV